MKIVIPILLTLLSYLQYHLWVGDGSLEQIERFRGSLAAQQQENEKLRERNQSLAAEVDDLKSGSDAIEELARGELGMIRPTESFYQIVDNR